MACSNLNEVACTVQKSNIKCVFCTVFLSISFVPYMDLPQEVCSKIMMLDVVRKMVEISPKAVEAKTEANAPLSLICYKFDFFDSVSTIENIFSLNVIQRLVNAQNTRPSQSCILLEMSSLCVNRVGSWQAPGTVTSQANFGETRS